MRALADQHRFDLLVVESTGISLPLPVAATFCAPQATPAASGDGHAPSPLEVLQSAVPIGLPRDEVVKVGLADVARLDSLVTVVDAQRFVANVMAAESLSDRGLALDEDDDRTVADLLIEQVKWGITTLFTSLLSLSGPLLYCRPCLACRWSLLTCSC